jgi:hypothetical protein
MPPRYMTFTGESARRPRRSLFSSPTTRTRRSETAHGRGLCCASQPAPLRVTFPVARHTFQPPPGQAAKTERAAGAAVT